MTEVVIPIKDGDRVFGEFVVEATDNGLVDVSLRRILDGDGEVDVRLDGAEIGQIVLALIRARTEALENRRG